MWSQLAADRVSPKRQRESRDLLPPAAEIHDAVQPRLVIRQLAFMNDQSRFVLPFQHLRNDLIEGDHFGFYSRRKQL